MRLSSGIGILGLAAQVPFRSEQPSEPTTMSLSAQDFSFKEGPDVFTPQDMLQLARPGTGVANDAGDLVIVPVSKYSFKEKK